MTRIAILGALLAACTTDGTFIKRTEDFHMDMEFQGLERSYEVHVPAGYTGERPTPLTFVLHGGGGTGSQIRQMTGFDAVADEMGFFAVYPTGKPTWANEGSDLQREGIDEIAFFTELIDRLENLLVVDDRRIYVTGFSAGGYLSHTLGCRLTGRFAAVAPVAGTLPAAIADECDSGTRVSVIAVHGTRDGSVPFTGDADRGILSADSSMQIWARRNGCNRSPKIDNLGTDPETRITVWRDTFEECDDGVELALYALEGDGHRWPTGYFDASRTIAGFLLRHRR